MRCAARASRADTSRLAQSTALESSGFRHSAVS
jgi:hypothetical protein